MDLLTKRLFSNVILSPNFRMLFEEKIELNEIIGL